MRNNKKRSDRRKKKSEIRIVKSTRKDGRRRPLTRKQRLRRKKIIRRRRILVIILLALVFALGSLIFGKFNSYKSPGYPSFRDEVLEGLTENIFVGKTDGRSLTSAEKLADFDKLYEAIIRNYPVSKANRDKFDQFAKSHDGLRKKVKNSKTDQEYFDIIKESLSILEDPKTFIVDKDTYNNLFNFYKNNKDTNIVKVLGNDQAVDRYKRMINKENINRDMITDNPKETTLIVRLPDFTSKKLDADLDLIAEKLQKGSIESIVFDLSNNTSIDSSYVNEFVTYFLDKDYEESNIFFYRGSLFENKLTDIKANDKSPYTTGKVKNLAAKYNKEVNNFDLDDYLYYDQIELKLKKKDDFKKRKIYVLTNENTANQAIRFAAILKENGAYTVKNALSSEKTPNDKIELLSPDFLLLDHSGLIIAINTEIKASEDKVLEYDQRINSENPDKAMMDIVK
ncbi:MAG: S41 family peptidase [Anaerococcus sp.]|uniref:S41 family peptidase n=2 Tax=Anaerococcus sp. TaxID=1872515 RepID=UPI0026382903|nr:S41 family peptidase [Anaerococcus sp.]MCI5971848.1 S41 family peptidase [Anaerococcus sp.]